MARRIAVNVAKLLELLRKPYRLWSLLSVVPVTRGTDWVNKTRLSRAGRLSIVRMLRIGTAGVCQVC